MRELNLANYTVTQEVINTSNPASDPVKVDRAYNMRDSVVALLFIPELKLGGLELLKTNILAMKIEECKEEKILLEESEWERIRNAVTVFKGFTRNDVELVKRILESKEIDINER